MNIYISLKLRTSNLFETTKQLTLAGRAFNYGSKLWYPRYPEISWNIWLMDSCSPKYGNIGFDWPIRTLDSPSIFQTPALWGRLPATESSCTSFIMGINHVFELGRLECTSVCWLYKRYLHWCWLYGLCFFWRFLIYYLSIHLPPTLEVNLVNGEPPHWNGKFSQGASIIKTKHCHLPCTFCPPLPPRSEHPAPVSRKTTKKTVCLNGQNWKLYDRYEHNIA